MARAFSVVMLRAVLRAIAQAPNPRFFPDALRSCRNAGQALDLYLNSSAQFNFQNYSSLLLYTLRKLRLTGSETAFDALTKDSLPRDVRFTRFLQDLAAQHPQMTLEAVIDTCIQVTQVSPLPTELQASLTTRLRIDWAELRTSPRLLSSALRLVCLNVAPTPESRLLLTDLLAALKPLLPTADAPSILTTFKCVSQTPSLRPDLLPILQPIFMKHIHGFTGKEIATMLQNANTQHWLTMEILEEGMSALVGKLHSLSTAEIVQLMRVYLIYVRKGETREVQRIPEQCIKRLLPMIRSCSPADLMFVLKELPMFRIATPHYYELLSVEVVRLLPELTLPDLVSAASSMASAGLKSTTFTRKVTEHLRIYLQQETNLVINPVTQPLLSRAKHFLLPELQTRKDEVKQLSLSTEKLLELMWAVCQLAVRVDVVPLHGEEWNAMMNMLKERLKGKEELESRDYERLTQVVWFSRNYFPTLSHTSASAFISAFHLDTSPSPVHLDR